MPSASTERRFPCWRAEVALLDQDCDFQRCPHRTEAAPGNCDYLDPDREHSTAEIAALLGFPSVAEAASFERQALHKYRHLYFRDSRGRQGSEFL